MLNFEILEEINTHKNNRLKKNALDSYVVSAASTIGDRAILLGNSPGEKRISFSASLYACSMPVIHTGYYMVEVCLYGKFNLCFTSETVRPKD